MKKQRCILSLLAATYLVGSFPVSAQASLSDFSEALKTLPDGDFEVVREENAVFASQVGAVTSYYLQGLAVTCDTPGDIIASGIGAIPVVWSDGKWGIGGIPAGGCRMQPLTGFAECYGKTEEYVSGSEYITYSVSAELEQLNSENTVYLLTVPPVLNDDVGYWVSDYTELVNAVAENDHMTLLGAVYGTQTSATLYQGVGRAAVLISEENTEQVLSVLSEYGKIEPYYSGYYLLENGDDFSFEKEMRLCEQIKEIDGVIDAYPAGIVLESISAGVTGFGIELLPYNEGSADTTTTTTTETTTTTTTTVTTTTTAGGVSTGDANMIYLLLAGAGAAAVAFFTKKRVRTSA